jgi:saccharopepsin
LSNSPQKYANIQEHAKALGQKYMGIKPESHIDQVFKAPYVADGLHPVPVSNFLNAQCTFLLYRVFRNYG